MGPAGGLFVPGSPHKSSGTDRSTVTNWKQCQGRTSPRMRRNCIWIQSCKRPHTALEHLHFAERAKRKPPSNKLQLSEYALPLAVSCWYARMCTYMCMRVRACVCACTRTHVSFDTTQSYCLIFQDIFSSKSRHACTHARAGVAFYLRSQNKPGGPVFCCGNAVLGAPTMYLSRRSSGYRVQTLQLFNIKHRARQEY